MTFDTTDLVSSLPLLFLTVAGIVLLMLDAFSRVVLVGRDHHLRMPSETSEAVAVPPPGSRNYLMPVTVLFLLATLAIMVWQAGTLPEGGVTIYRGMLVVDRFGLFVSGICVAAATLGVVSAPAYMRAHRMEFGEFYALLVFSLCGMIILVQAADLVTVFLGIETMSLGAYVLTGSWRRSPRSSEAAMKYFLVGAFVSGLLARLLTADRDLGINPLIGFVFLGGGLRLREIQLGRHLRAQVFLAHHRLQDVANTLGIVGFHLPHILQLLCIQSGMVAPLLRPGQQRPGLINHAHRLG